MSVTRLIGAVVGVVALFLLAQWLRDPHRTPLPFGSNDLSPVQAQLAKLPADERALVEAYVKRSNGDVLPPRFADPDNPLTARTFAEAIALERRWQEKMSVQKSLADARAAERERALEPLRRIVEARVVRRELLRRDELYARPEVDAVPGAPKQGRDARADERSVFVITVAIDNHGDSDLVELKGSLQARDRDAYLPLDLCWVDINEQQRVAAHGRGEIRCANPNRSAGASERDFIADPPGRFTVTWEPKHVRLSDGTVLDAKL